MAKKMTAAQREYKKEQKRLKDAQRRLEKQGYYFVDDIIPKMPKRVTAKKLKEIKEMRPLDLRRASLWVNPSTGELMGTGLELYAQQRKAKAQKLSAAGRSAENVSRLREYAAKRAGKTIESWESYHGRNLREYYDTQVRISYSYDDEVVDNWRKFWPLMEATYGWETVAECIVKIDGVPDPDGVPASQQWLAYIRFSTDLLRELKKIGKVSQDVQTALDDIATAIDEVTPIEDEVYEDLNWR